MKRIFLSLFILTILVTCLFILTGCGKQSIPEEENRIEEEAVANLELEESKKQ